MAKRDISVASFVFGTLSLTFVFVFPFAAIPTILIGLVTGIMGLRKPTWRVAISGISFCMVAISVLIIFTIFAIYRNDPL